MSATASQENDFWCSVRGQQQDDGDLIMNMATRSHRTLKVIMLKTLFHMC